MRQKTKGPDVEAPQLSQPDNGIGSNGSGCDAVSESDKSCGTGVSSLCKRTTELEAAGFLDQEFTETAQRVPPHFEAKGQEEFDVLVDSEFRGRPSRGKSQLSQTSAVSQKFEAERLRMDALQAPSDAVNMVKRVMSWREHSRPVVLSDVAAAKGFEVFDEEQQGLECDELIEAPDLLQRLEPLAEAWDDPGRPGCLSRSWQKLRRQEIESKLRPYRDEKYQRLLVCYASLLNELAARGEDIEKLPSECVLSFEDLNNANIAYKTRRNWKRSKKREVDKSLAPPQHLQQQSMIVAPMIGRNPQDPLALASLRGLMEVANSAKCQSIVEGRVSQTNSDERLESKGISYEASKQKMNEKNEKIVMMSKKQGREGRGAVAQVEGPRRGAKGQPHPDMLWKQGHSRKEVS